MSLRSLTLIEHAAAVTDGAGVKIKRSIAGNNRSLFDPFLMLDEIVSDNAADYIGGFPEHPHRGFETVTYMLEGHMEHRDHLGNTGQLVAGGVQWMTAGRGVIHSEMPKQDQGKLHGFQLWINLPAANKMQSTYYREISPDMIPQVTLSSDATAKVIAGQFNQDDNAVQGPIQDVVTRPDYYDIVLRNNTELNLRIDSDKHACIYVYQDTLSVFAEDSQHRDIEQQSIGLLGEGNYLRVRANPDAHFLLLAAVPIGEPVVQWGPFVMNSEQEIQQALMDYRAGKLTD